MATLERFAKKFEKDQIIFSEYERGDSFYLIQSGEVKILKLFGAIEKTLDVLKEGEFFGEMAIMDDSPRSATAVAETDLTVLEFKKEGFKLLVENNPQVAINLLKRFSNRIHFQKRRLGLLALPDLECRVADTLILLSNMVEDQREDGKRILDKTSRDIAQWSAISEEECGSILVKFIEKGRIELDKNIIIVNNVNEISRFLTLRLRGATSEN